MDDRSISVEGVVSRYFIKYDNLKLLVPYAYAGSQATHLNIYIDLYGMFHTLYSRSYRTSVSEYTSFTTLVINMCAHYRSYFKYLGVSTKFFLISSYNIPAGSLLQIPVYNKTMVDKLKNKYINEMMELNLALLELICPYLPDIHFLKTQFESSVLMNHLIDLEDHSIPSLIITTDIYPYQLCAVKDNVTIFWPRKVFGGDASYAICEKTHPEYLKSFWGAIERKMGKTVSYETVGSISPSNFVLLAALNRFPDRNLPNILNVTRASKLIAATPGYREVRITPDILFELNQKDVEGIDYNTILKRYQALDINYQSLLFNESLESKSIHYENLNDPDAVQRINDKYFKENPIDIFRL